VVEAVGAAAEEAEEVIRADGVELTNGILTSSVGQSLQPESVGFLKTVLTGAIDRFILATTP
jgi:hypothetical protein